MIYGLAVHCGQTLPVFSEAGVLLPSFATYTHCAVRVFVCAHVRVCVHACLHLSACARLCVVKIISCEMCTRASVRAPVQVHGAEDEAD